jgi:hypothetical protein
VLSIEYLLREKLSIHSFIHPCKRLFRIYLIRGFYDSAVLSEVWEVHCANQDQSKTGKNAHRWKIRKSQKNSFVNKNEIKFGKRGTPSHPSGLFFYNLELKTSNTEKK